MKDLVCRRTQNFTIIGKENKQQKLHLHENQYISGTDYLQIGNLIEEFWYGDISLTLKLQY